MNLFRRRQVRHFDIVAERPRSSWTFPVRFATVCAVVLIVAILAPVTYTNWQALANTTTLTPVTCQGDWEQGAQTLGVATMPDQKLFCSFSPFPGEEVETVAEATLVVAFGQAPLLDASASVLESVSDTATTTDDAQPEELAATTSPATLAVPEEATTTSEVLSVPEEATTTPTEPAEAPAEEPPSEPTPDETAVEDPAPEPPPEPAPVETQPEPEPASEESTAPEEPLVRWPFILQTARAQEAAAVDAADEIVPDEVPEESETTESTVTVSYTIDGVVWTDLDEVVARSGEEHTFALELEDTGSIETLVVRLAASSVAAPVYLASVKLVVRTDATLEPEIPIVLEPTLTPSAPYEYRREFEIDPDATHSCAAVPETLTVTRQESVRFFITLSHGEDSGREVLELGSMPYGIDMRFALGDSHFLDKVESREEVQVEVTIDPGAQRGSLSVPIIYGKRVDGEDSFVVCQVNVVND